MTKLLLIISLLLLITNARAQNQTVNDGGLTIPLSFGAGDCGYHWTNSNPAIGLPANGSGNISSFKAINNGRAPITATITATPFRRPKAYIIGNAGAFSVIDLETKKLTNSFSLSYGNYGLAISNDSNMLYVTGFVQATGRAEAAMIDLKGYGLPNPPLKFANGSTPRGIAVNSAGTRVYICTKDTGAGIGNLVVVDARTFGIVTTVPILADPSGILISPDDSKIYVAQRGANKVAVIDAATNVILNQIAVGNGPNLMAITHDGQFLYVSNTDGKSVSAINTTNGSVDNIPVARAASGLALAPGDRYLYMVNTDEVSVSVLDVQTRTVVKTIDLPGGKDPMTISVTPDGAEAFVVNENGLISVINIATNTLDDPYGTPVGAVAFGNFMSPGTTCPPETYTITVLPNLPPQVTTNGDLSSLRTTYGDASMSAPMTVNGEYLKAPVQFTAPAGVQISLDNINFGNTFTLTPDADGKINNRQVYVRIGNTTPAGNFGGEITITSGSTVDVKTAVRGVIIKAKLSLAARPVTKKYGETLTNGPGSTAFDVTGMKNNESVASVTIDNGQAAPPTAKAGTYPGSVKVSSPAGPGFNAENYDIGTSVPADATIEKVPLEIKADDRSRPIGKANPDLTATYIGFANGETAAQLATQPVLATVAGITSPAGKYPITISGATSDNYIINLSPGTLTIYTAAQSMVIPNTFTPNGDNINDRWTIADLQYHPSCRVQIFDRRGGQIYNSFGYGSAWDGTYNGSPLPAGTYFYLIEFSTKERSVGSVTILR